MSFSEAQTRSIPLSVLLPSLLTQSYVSVYNLCMITTHTFPLVLKGFTNITSRETMK